MVKTVEICLCSGARNQKSKCQQGPFHPGQRPGLQAFPASPWLSSLLPRHFWPLPPVNSPALLLEGRVTLDFILIQRTRDDLRLNFLIISAEILFQNKVSDAGLGCRNKGGSTRDLSPWLCAAWTQPPSWNCLHLS